MQHDALARKIDAVMRSMHRDHARLCALLTEAAAEATNAGYISATVESEVIEPKEEP